MSANFREFSAVYSVSYFLILGLSGLLTFNAVNADFEVLFGMFNASTRDGSWAYKIAITSAVSISIALIASTSNIIKILSHGLLREEVLVGYDKDGEPVLEKNVNRVDHRLQLLFNIVLFVPAIWATFYLSKKTEFSVIDKGRDTYTQTKKQYEEHNDKQLQQQNDRILRINSLFTSDSIALIQTRESDLRAACGHYLTEKKRYDARIESIKDQIQQTKDKKQKTELEASIRWILSDKNYKYYDRKVGQLRKKADRNFSDGLRELRAWRKDQLRTIDARIDTSATLATAIFKKDLNQLDETITSASFVFKYRNIIINGLNVLCVAMIALYYLGVVRRRMQKNPIERPQDPDDEENDESGENLDDWILKNKIVSGGVSGVDFSKFPPPPKRQNNDEQLADVVEVTPDEDPEEPLETIVIQESHNKQPEPEPQVQTEKTKIVKVVQTVNAGPLASRARRRWELGKTSAGETTRKNNIIKCLSDVIHLSSLGFYCQLSEGSGTGRKLSVEFVDKYGGGGMCEDLKRLKSEYKNEINNHRLRSDDLKKYKN